MQRTQILLNSIALSNFIGFDLTPKKNNYDKLSFSDLSDFVNKIESIKVVNLCLRSFNSFNQVDAMELLKIINDANCQYIIKVERDDEFDVVFKAECSNAQTLWLEVHKTTFDFELYRGNNYDSAVEIHFSTIHTCQAYQMLYMRGFDIPHFATGCVTLESLGLANHLMDKEV